jgi:hypothetical protein
VQLAHEVPPARVCGNHDGPVVVDAIDFMGRTYTGDRVSQPVRGVFEPTSVRDCVT